jgi:hypothetical protein
MSIEPDFISEEKDRKREEKKTFPINLTTVLLP